VQRRSPFNAPRAAQLAVALAVVVATGCSGAAASSGGSSAAEPPASGPATPPASTSHTHTYVPAAGTDTSGLIFQSYSDPKLGYRLLYPGGWHVSRGGGLVRIAKLGNSIVIASRKSKNAPKVKGVRAAIDKQVKKKAILDLEKRPREVELNGNPAISMVFTKDKPATDTSAEDTLRVYRYLLFHKGHILILSLQTPTSRDNGNAYRLIANSFHW
jgi:hypothetical protein